MPNNYLSVLYKHIIQVENKNVGLSGGGAGGGHKHTIASPIKKVCVCVGGGGGGACAPLPHRFLRQCIYIWKLDPTEIDPTTHRTTSELSTTRVHLAPCVYVIGLDISNHERRIGKSHLKTKVVGNDRSILHVSLHSHEHLHIYKSSLRINE